MTPEERATKREEYVQAMIAKGYTRKRADELQALITKALFRPGGRFERAADE